MASGLGRAGVVAALVLGTTIGVGCRGCGESAREAPADASAPTMPTGLLTPSTDSPPRPADDVAPSPAERLAMARGKTGGDSSPWIELQLARANDGPARSSFERWQSDSRFLSLDAMTLLYEPFARSLPGFDLFLPRLLDSAALRRLQSELVTLKAQLAAMSNVVAAKARWGEVSTLIAALPDDVAWLSARAALLGTVDALSVLASELAKQGRGLWVVGL
jgi:hypothetical protein